MNNKSVRNYTIKYESKVPPQFSAIAFGLGGLYKHLGKIGCAFCADPFWLSGVAQPAQNYKWTAIKGPNEF